MSTRLSPRPGPLLVAVALLIAAPAAAQLGGGPPNPEIGARMRGVPQPPFPAAVDKLPTPLLKLPRGFRAEVFVSGDRKSTRLNSSHSQISYAVFCLKKKKN